MASPANVDRATLKRDFYMTLGMSVVVSLFIAKKVPYSLTPADVSRSYRDFFIGLFLAISSNLFIGSSFIIKKKGLLKVQQSSGHRAGKGGHAYLREWLWWAGFLTMAVGEVANFVAYMFAPATLVTPLGALSVLVSAIMASKILNETLNILGKVGCFLCVAGATMIIIHSPKEGEVETMEDLAEKLVEPGFIVYTAVVVFIAGVLVCYFSPHYGHKNVLVYTTICSLIGSLSVMACKGVGVALRQTVAGGGNAFTSWLTYALAASVFACIAVQMNYLNRALDTFNTSLVSPIYYVFFTTFTIIASAILFKEWRHLGGREIAGNACGFATIVGAIFLLHAFREFDITLRRLRATVADDNAASTTAERRMLIVGAAATAEREDGGGGDAC
ncbi:PREDICTED: magnesium transporter NIPA2-like [Priapulus caudatus]|uniref:Magnesium transporter NIPA2-like n=1 Tax=Priapulus caudatus TaxID=37621 RepID=A0ABM1EEQ1_PRICU|nr:PREDICTED: magnesium transporter NIPA2-like [Priapulus caudatus]